MGGLPNLHLQLLNYAFISFPEPVHIHQAQTEFNPSCCLSHTRVTVPDKRELGSRFHGGPPQGSLGPDTIKATDYMGASWVHGHG